MIMGFKKVKVALFLEHFLPEAFPFVSLKSLFDIKTKRLYKDLRMGWGYNKSFNLAVLLCEFLLPLSNI